MGEGEGAYIHTAFANSHKNVTMWKKVDGVSRDQNERVMQRQLMHTATAAETQPE